MEMIIFSVTLMVVMAFATGFYILGMMTCAWNWLYIFYYKTTECSHEITELLNI